MFTSDKPHYENVPFEVPSSWVWTTLGDIAEIITGNTPSKDIKEYYSGNIPFFKPTDLEQGIHTKYSKDRLTPLGFEQSRKLPANSVLVTCIGATIGKTGLTTVEGTCNQQINAIIPTSAILAKFLFYVCISDYMQHEIKANASATTLPILNKGNFSKIAITIPPLQEQSRIVKEIEHWLSLVDCIEENKDNLQKTIREAKSKILTLAIHGKLVPQDPTDEPAAELLKRINPKTEIACDNGHYQKLPKGWCETTLKHVITIKSGYPINVRNCMQGHYPIYGGNGITGYTVDHNIKEPTIVVGRVGFYCGSVYLVKEKAWVSDNAFTITIHKDIFYKKYLYYLIQFLNLRKYSNSTAQPVISGKTIYPIHVIIPPINEQHRIVSKIEEIFAQLDAIEASL